MHVTHVSTPTCPGSARTGTRLGRDAGRVQHDLSVRINELRKYRHPDISDLVVHFSGRSGTAGPGVPERIRAMKDWERLGQILVDQRIFAFPPFGSSEPVVCFTECTTAGIKTLMADHRYTPCGLAVAKDVVFHRGGGPALYVRGDEWEHVDALPVQLRARATRLWPGATSADGTSLPWHLDRPSEWLHEREWRVAGSGDPPSFPFEWSDVGFVIAPDPRWADFVAGFIGDIAPDYEPYFRNIPVVAVASDGTAISDPAGVWV